MVKRAFGQHTINQLFPVFFGLLSGFAVFYFLYVFGAYGIQKGLSYSGHSHLFRSLSFGILTFAYLTLLEAWLKPKLKIKGFKSSILWYLMLIFVGIQLIFLLFNFFWNWQEWNLSAYLLIVKEFPLLILFPLSFYLSIKQILKPKATEVAYLSFQSINGKDQLKTTLQDFLYANSSENYVSIAYISNHQIKQHLIRKPLKILEEELKTYPDISRIHRSYLVNRVNIQAIKQVKGKVFVEVNGESLPVSKQFQSDFLN